MGPETRGIKRARGELESRLSEIPGQATRNPGTQNHGLCALCSSLKLDALFSGRRPVFRGHVMKKLGPVATWAVDSCSLCSLLAASLPSSERRALYCHLRLFSADRFLPIVHSAVLELDRYHYTSLFVPHPEAENYVRLLKKDSIDFNILLGWLRSCRDEHTGICDIGTSPGVPFLKVIDSNTRRIVPALNEKYLTLSYTWGSNSKNGGENKYSEVLPDDLPDTIEDAITVTRNLGFQYLWIDRYCINQQNEKEASALIRQMDLIYKNSEITIIAAAGKDPSYGLPGVGRRHRAPQPHAMVDDHFLVSALNDVSYYIRNSLWISRGWTYQEGLLSRRRLLFTDQQVSFECHNVSRTEARLAHLPAQKFFDRKIQGRILPPKGIGEMPQNVLQCIEEYSHKSLTKDSDILNGILGILRAFETSVHAIQHYWGVPIIPILPEILQSAKRSGETIPWAQAWGFVVGLSWELTQPSNRRPGFPSWSWTGWLGPVRWGIDNDLFTSLRIDPGIKLSVELQNGRILEWDEYRQSYDELNSSSYLTHCIRISAWTTSIRLLGRTNSIRQIEYEARIDLEDGSYLHWRFCPTTKEPLSNQHFTGILLGWAEPQDEFKPNGPLVLVTGRVGDRTERVGLAGLTTEIMNYMARTECMSTLMKMANLCLPGTGSMFVSRFW